MYKEAYMMQDKKMLVMNILNILKDYTDENHTLTQQDILKILERDYDMIAERKAVKRNILYYGTWGLMRQK